MENDIFGDKNDEKACLSEHLLKYLSKRMPCYAWLEMTALSGKYLDMFQECYIEKSITIL